MANRERFKLSDLTDEQLMELFESVQLDEEDSDDEDSDDEDNDFSVVEALNNAIEEADTVSFIVGNEENVVNNAQDPKPTRKATKRPRSPLPTSECESLPNSGGFNAAGLDSISREPTRILWREQSMQLHVNNIAFRGDSTLPAKIKELETPTQLFCKFFNGEIMKLIVDETMRAALTDNISNNFRITIDDIHHYIGILIYMSIYRYPNLRSYWGQNAFGPIKKCMTRHRFESIKKYLSLRDESERIKKGEPGYDPLFRTRKLIHYLNQQFDSVPKQPRLCIDEQMCSTKMKHHLRQYMPNKPHKWDIKLLVLCDSFGYAYRFEVYSGAGDNVILPGHPDLGASANIVVRSTQSVQSFKNHIIYFDNFYTSLPLMVYLRAKGIYSLGTIRRNRIPNCKLPNEDTITKLPRGSIIEYVGCSYGIELTNVLWKDSKAVRFLSTYVDVKPFAKKDPSAGTSKASRFDRKSKKYIEIDCPQIVHEYNAHMGGVDLMDGLMGRYHIRAKTRDAATRIFYHLIDMAVTNSYILDRRIQMENKAKKEKLLELPDFREAVGAGMVAYNSKNLTGRPSA